MDKVFRLQDVYLASFLALQGLPFSFERKDNKILFCFESSEKLYTCLQLFNEGTTVNLSEFISKTKELRAKMYEAKVKG